MATCECGSCFECGYDQGFQAGRHAVSWVIVIGGTLCAVWLLSGCAGEDPDTDKTPAPQTISDAGCSPGLQIACLCPNGDTSTQTCSSAGTYGACECADAASGPTCIRTQAASANCETYGYGVGYTSCPETPSFCKRIADGTLCCP